MLFRSPDSLPWVWYFRHFYYTLRRKLIVTWHLAYCTVTGLVFWNCFFCLRHLLTVKTEICPQVCALDTCVAFEKAAHLRNSSNCLLVGEELPKPQGCLFVYSVFFRLLGLQPLRYPTSQAFACVWLLPWIQPSVDPAPFPLWHSWSFPSLSLVQGGLFGLMCLLES